ncbi:hypothetical protein GCM10023318_47640 [Nocardia callitridis]|uniref:HTH cro/C1-type domain-containing protein n=1 Tax=Nocardia callitridis TaxID=648753 RepID=A0ABP9KRY4_9NOCA
MIDIRSWRGPRQQPRPPVAPSPLLRVIYGEVLRDERRDQDRTLAEVSRQVGMSKQYLSEIERGRKEPSSEILHSVCEALELPVEQLLTRGARRLSAFRRLDRRPASEPRIELRAA